MKTYTEAQLLELSVQDLVQVAVDYKIVIAHAVISEQVGNILIDCELFDLSHLVVGSNDYDSRVELAEMILRKQNGLPPKVWYNSVMIKDNVKSKLITFLKVILFVFMVGIGYLVLHHVNDDDAHRLIDDVVEDVVEAEVK